MIDPSDVIKFDRTKSELQEWWLFSVLVAGKTALTQARLLDRFLLDNGWTPGQEPFDVIRRLSANGTLELRMREARLGQYTRLVRTFSDSLILDLSNCTIEQLEAIHGVGPKTARMFLMHSRRDQRVAALDTHILKHLAASGYVVPKVTPTGAKYRELEALFLKLADAANMSPADYDLMIWKRYAQRFEGTVKWFDAKKGMGAITPSDGGGTMLILNGSSKPLTEGQKVTFRIDRRESGHAAAVEIK